MEGDQKKSNVIAIVVCIVIVFIIAVVGYYIFDYNYNADARNAKNARETADQIQQYYYKVKEDSDNLKKDIDSYQRNVDMLKKAK